MQEHIPTSVSQASDPPRYESESTIASDKPVVQAPSQAIQTKTQRRRVPNCLFYGDDWVNQSIGNHTAKQLHIRLVGHPRINDTFLHSVNWNLPYSADYACHQALELLHSDPVSNEVEWSHPFAFSAKATSLDNPTLRDIQKMGQDEMNEWYNAMDIELAALQAKDTMVEILHSEVP
jgi:hypothetical protein